MPVSSLLATQRQSASRSDATVFDFLSRSTGSLGIMLMPSRTMGQDLEMGLTRNYWAGAMASRYRGDPSAMRAMATPEAFTQMEGLDRGEWVELPIPAPSLLNDASSYPPQARQEFGRLIDRLDADWALYLARSAVTIRNVQYPLVVDGHPAAVVPRFTISQVGSPEFWRAADDLHDIIEQTNCVAQRFLVEREYVAADDMPPNPQCALSQIRLPGR